MIEELIRETEAAVPAPSAPPPGAAADWTVPQNWEHFTAEEHDVWDILFARQQEMLHGRAVRAFEESLGVLKLSRPGIPELGELNERLLARTGWTVVSVPGLVPDDIFFEHLAARRFPAGNFIRSREAFDYIEEPDVFHDVFGHVPMLADPVYADYMQAYGRAGWKAMRHNRLKALGALYWYTVEFGLVREGEGLRAYGAGILSGPSEAVFALEARSPNRIMLNVDRVMRTDYVISDLQPTYFVIESFDDLLARIEQADLASLYERIESEADLAPGLG